MPARFSRRQGGEPSRMAPMPNQKYLSRMNKLKGSLRPLAFRPFLAGRFDERSVLLLTSSPRSGSTWLGNVLRAIPKSCVLFEPLHLTHVPEAKEAGFTWRTYVPPQTRWPEGEAFLKRIFEGRVINEWTLREMSFREAVQSRTMIIKCVRATRLLPWLCQTFPIRAPIFLIRHPCAVIASQLKSAEWRTAKRPPPPPYIEDYPVFSSHLSKSEGVEGHLAALWALDQLPPLMVEAPHPWRIVTYEELFLRPTETVAKICQTCSLPIDMDRAMASIREPSAVVHSSGISGISGWRRQLTGRQVSRIIDTIQGFGIRFYTDDLEPDYDNIAGGRSAQQIREAGR